MPPPKPKNLEDYKMLPGPITTLLTHHVNMAPGHPGETTLFWRFFGSSGTNSDSRELQRISAIAVFMCRFFLGLLSDQLALPVDVDFLNMSTSKEFQSLSAFPVPLSSFVILRLRLSTSSGSRRLLGTSPCEDSRHKHINHI